MKTQDGRKLSPKTLEQIRIRAVQRVQAGESPETVIKTLGFSRACIYNWLARYRAYQQNPDIVKQWKEEVFPRNQKES